TESRSLAARGTRVITRAEGVYNYEADDKRILDGMSGLWCVALGYGRRELIDAAIAQLEQLPYYNSFFQCATPAAIELATLLAEVTPAQFQHVFFTGSGSEANDTAVRLVRHYWELECQPQRNVIIGRRNGYHGSTLAGASLGGMKFMHAQGGLPLPNFEHIEEPYWFEYNSGRSPEEFGLAAARALETKILELGADRVAAFIGEPVQGAGGVIIPPDSYWPEIQRICDRYGILLICDEVICGFGRTGRWFACERFGARPDLMPIAKALSSGYLPIGGLMVGERVARVLIDKGGEFAHGFTYSAHPVTCAVAVAALKVIRDEKIVENVRDSLEPYFQARWRKLGEHRLVGEARGVGLLGALELVKNKEPLLRFEPRGKVGERARDISIRNGLVMRAVRDTLICAPPLVITMAQIDELIDKAQQTLDETYAQLRTESLL
ncbi:MAG: aspartate aminotransferase family protein, partial [Steroidobacteraceae bacterium]